MSEVLKKPYEISMWEDVLTFVTLTGEKTQIEEGDDILHQYYKEQKLAIIGSNTMSSPIRAINPVLKTNINGTNTLTFSIYSRYYDEEIDDFVNNPFQKLLVNERKIKLKYGQGKDAKWYDFIIKECEEDSEKDLFTYTAKDLFINELSKTGFNLQFDQELENNMGNITTLADRILEESDWKVKTNGLVLEQTKEEPLYPILLQNDINASKIKNEKEKITIQAGQTIYVFYSIIDNKEEYFQFIYVPLDQYQKDDRRVITNKDCNYVVQADFLPEGQIQVNGKEIAKYTELSITSNYKGKKYIRKQISKYDSTIDKYVSLYTLDQRDVYGYTEKEYLSPNLLTSFITNGKDFSSTTGWKGVVVKPLNPSPDQIIDPTQVPDLNVEMVPDVRDIPPSSSISSESFLTYDKTVTSQALFNSGLIDSRSALNELVAGNNYIFRIKYGIVQNTSGRPQKVDSTSLGLTLKIAPYTMDEGVYVLGEPVFEGTIAAVKNSVKTFQEIRVTCLKSLSYSDMLSSQTQLGTFIFFEGGKTKFYIQEVQFFKEILRDNKQPSVPSNTFYPEDTIEGAVKTKYYYYYPDKNYRKVEDIKFLYEGDTPSKSFLPKYNIDSFEKVRMIDGSESNRFNLLQSLCETFECWIRFEVEHDDSGRILLGKDSPNWENWDSKKREEESYRQQKWVSFYESVEKPNYCGFKYGINLKSIKRRLESDAIVSKIIVKNNSNEFGEGGFCSIARASENYSRENFIFDFSYFIQQGLLDYNIVYNDLYLDSESQGYLGYYKKLRKLNIQSQKIIEEQTLLATDIIKTESKLKGVELQKEKTELQLQETYKLILDITGRSFQQLQNDKENLWWKDEKIISSANLIVRLESLLKTQEQIVFSTKETLNKAQGKYDLNKQILEDNLKKKQQHHSDFYKKYSRFIQEGSWISEDYFDDNLYYFDAESTLHTSSQPKVSYTINVLELSQLEGYENYIFNLGDKSFIEDTEFFGWTFKEGIKTPYQEEITVTEISWSLDQPELNTVTVQNYKTQFEDLFQRITATTQALEFSSGQYNKTSSIIEEDGTIKFDTLQNSLSNNAFVIQNSKDQSVTWDETGITTTSASAPNEIVRIVSGGIFLSEDGGLKWNTGITGKGINAKFLTTGIINTDKINIMSGAFPSFRWDTKGITAYRFSVNNGQPENFNYGNFIRLDQFGLYGIDLPNEFNALEKDANGDFGEKKIIKNAIFSLTWSGFHIRSKHSVNGGISISSDNDIEVLNQNNKAQVKIGLLVEAGENSIYGIQISDSQGHPVIEQSSEGKVWIKDEIKIGNEKSSVSVGFLQGLKNNDPNQEESSKPKIHEVINANEKFIVYEDGSIRALDGYFEGNGTFKGAVYAESGKIGNMTIGEIQGSVDASKKITIYSPKGDSFKKTGLKTVEPLELPLQIVFDNLGEVSWEKVHWWISSDFSSWSEIFTDNKVTPTLKYNENIFKEGLCYIKATYNIIVNGATQNFEDIKTFYVLSNGEEPVFLRIDSSNGDIYTNGNIETQLRATVLRGGEDITSSFSPEKFYWKKFDQNGIEDTNWHIKNENAGNIVSISHLDVEQKATFTCELELS